MRGDKTADRLPLKKMPENGSFFARCYAFIVYEYSSCGCRQLCKTAFPCYRKGRNAENHGILRLGTSVILKTFSAPVDLYLNSSWRLILAEADQVQPRHVMVLGAGECHEIPFAN